MSLNPDIRKLLNAHKRAVLDSHEVSQLWNADKISFGMFKAAKEREDDAAQAIINELERLKLDV